MFDLVAALTAAAALLLLASSVAKLLSPDATSGALLTLLPALRRRPRLLRPTARAVGLGEGVVALLVLGLGGRLPALLLALAYLTFAIAAYVLVRAPKPVSCGCFGRSDTPVTTGHVVMNLLALAAAVATVVRPVPALGGLTDDGVAVAVAGPVLVALVAWTAYLSVTALPALSAARRLGESA